MQRPHRPPALRNRRPGASNRAALAQATQQAHETLADTFELSDDDLVDKSVVIIGAGVSGLFAAYKIKSCAPRAHVTVIEAADQVGGRCLSLRDGNSFTEDRTADLHSTPAETQHVKFLTSPGEQTEPYLNAGPGRIPSSHVNLLDLLKELGVQLEVYIMESESNLVQLDTDTPGKHWPHNGEPVVNRRLLHNSRGWLAEMVYQNAETLLTDLYARRKQKVPDLAEKAEQLREFMQVFGELTEEGMFVAAADAVGEVELPGSDRAGYLTLPTVDPGKIAPAIPMHTLLESEFWRTGIYQPKDMFWQPSLFHPVGGMDLVVRAIHSAAARAGVDIRTGSPVTSVGVKAGTDQYEIVTDGETFVADYVMCNLAMPFLEDMITPELFGRLEKDFQQGLNAVYSAQKNSTETNRFLAYTTKVGWQAERKLWQEVQIKTEADVPGGRRKRSVRTDQLKVVPIYGGISWTTHPITQIWYPSTEYHAHYGVLTGCYNFAENARNSGELSVRARLDQAREGAALFDREFAAGLRRGVAIAWHKMPFIKGGWSQWHAVFGEEREVDDDDVEDRRAKVFNDLAEGSSNKQGGPPTLFIIGDQMSSLVGWQEGAITAALNAISRIANPGVHLKPLKRLPDSRLMVEGVRFG